MRKNTKRKLFSILALAGIALTLSACADEDMDMDDSGSSSSPHAVKSNPTSYKTAKHVADKSDGKDRVYKLAFFDYMGTSDNDTLRYRLGYYKHGQLYVRTLNSDDDHFKEVIAPNLAKPYVVIDEDGNYFIHRPPYNMYNQPIVKGKITDKLTK